ncbi:MAG: ECF transporter S component [Turicibacter sp.]|nr:ECF transporter S component [Turicibacter sp.]
MNVFKSTKKLVLMGVLSALASILMLVEVPYPPFPFLKFDISDLPTLLVAQAFGIVPAIATAVIASLISFMVRGSNTPYGIGLVTAALSSTSLAILYVVASKSIKIKGIGSRLAHSGAILAGYSLFMALCNFLFITPIFAGGLWFTDVYHWLDMNAMAGWIGLEIPFNVGYTAMIAIIYIPFNLLKGGMVLGLYQAISPRLLKVLNQILGKGPTAAQRLGQPHHP